MVSPVRATSQWGSVMCSNLVMREREQPLTGWLMKTGSAAGQWFMEGSLAPDGQSGKVLLSIGVHGGDSGDGHEFDSLFACLAWEQCTDNFMGDII